MCPVGLFDSIYVRLLKIYNQINWNYSLSKYIYILFAIQQWDRILGMVTVFSLDIRSNCNNIRNYSVLGGRRGCSRLLLSNITSHKFNKMVGLKTRNAAE